MSDRSGMVIDHRDRVLDWRQELTRLEPDLSALPLAARRAVRAVLEDFVREDAESDGLVLQSLLDDAA